MKYGFIYDESRRYPVVSLCKVMGIKRSSYYDWKQHRRCKIISSESFRLRVEMKKLFNESRQSMGYRRLSKALKSKGFKCGYAKIRRLMKVLHLQVKRKRKYKITTDSNHRLPVADNVLNRAFNPEQPNQAWGADITYIGTQEGWLYLAVVIDLYSKRVVGWCIDKRMKTALVTRALMMAINQRQPGARLIHHSDRGSQYASHQYQGLLAQRGIIASMSRKGNCWDNAPIERFFSSLKREWIGEGLYQTRQKAINDIKEYVAVYYNAKRLHSTLGYVTPLEFEKVA